MLPLYCGSVGVYEGLSDPAFLHIGISEPFIYATTMSPALKGVCRARWGGHVAMATVGVKAGGWWLGCGVWANEWKPLLLG